MRTHAPCIFGVAILAASCQASAAPLPQVHEIAVAHERPAGAPKLSDVCFSSRWKHPSNAKDPHDTFATAKAFGVTQYLWVYTSDSGFIRDAKKTARSFQCALNSMVPDAPGGGRKRGRIMDLDGNLISAPWMRSWKDPAWGCCNSPEWRESYFALAKKSLDAGADLFQMDDPGLNHRAMDWGGCFCPHCVKGFRGYLKSNCSPEKLKELGIADIGTFDYAAHLRAQKAPVGDAFKRWDGGPLKALFNDFLKHSVEQFYVDMRKRIDAYAGRRVPFSSNNYKGLWSFPYGCFDFGVAELPHRDVDPVTIYERFHETSELGRAQVFTLVSEDVAETRRVVATSYACGGHLLVPWDVYLRSTPTGSDRYYGKPEDYADLYQFVQAHAALFDGYEDAAVVLPGKKDERYPAQPPVAITGADSICAFVRAVPGQAAAPVAIHLVDWGKTPQPFTLQLTPERFASGTNMKASLLQPGKEPVGLKASRKDERISVEMPEIAPWAVVLVKRGTGS